MNRAAARPDFVQVKTVKGRTYVYFRHTPTRTLKKLPVDLTFKSAVFRKEYDACLRAIGKAVAVAAAKPKAAPPARKVFALDTTGKAIELYRASGDFKALKPRTAYNYGKALDIMCDVAGEFPLRDWDVGAVNIYTDKVLQERGAAAADQQLHLLSNVWLNALDHRQFRLAHMANPTMHAKRRYKVMNPAKPWDDAAEDRFMNTAPERLRLAKMLLHFSAQRGGDCVKLKWADYDGKGLTVTPEKTDGGGAPEPIYHRCPKVLREALDRAPRDGETILVNAWGRRYARAAVLSQAIRKHLVKIGLRRQGVRGLLMHGLRKQAARDVAHLLVGVQGIKSVTGHKSDKMAAYYAAQAEQRVINDAVVERWDEAIERRERERAAKRAAEVTARRGKFRTV